MLARSQVITGGAAAAAALWLSLSGGHSPSKSQPLLSLTLTLGRFQVAAFLDSNPDYTPDGWESRDVTPPLFPESARPFSRRPSMAQLEALSAQEAAAPRRNAVPFWLLVLMSVLKA